MQRLSNNTAKKVSNISRLYAHGRSAGSEVMAVSHKLTYKQQCFCEEYLIDLNATQAAIRAGYSAKSASNISSELLAKESITENINRAMAIRSRRTGVNADRVIQELAKVAFLNPTDLVDFNRAMLLDGPSSSDTAAIASVKVKEMSGDIDSIEREIKFCDKLKALELLGKHLGMFTDNIHLTGDVGVEIINDIPREAPG
jgi:phage terminase small subunit